MLIGDAEWHYRAALLVRNRGEGEIELGKLLDDLRRNFPLLPEETLDKAVRENIAILASLHPDIRPHLESIYDQVHPIYGPAEWVEHISNPHVFIMFTARYGFYHLRCCLSI